MLWRVRSGALWWVAGGQLLLALVTLAGANAAILPDQLAGAARKDAKAVPAPDPKLFDEYGFEEGEQAVYGDRTVTGWRFRDSTGALAAWQSLRPADAKPLKMKLTNPAVRTPDGALFDEGNYVFQVTGPLPTEQQLANFYGSLAKLDSSALPVVSTYLPAEGLVANSERFITGPIALEKFAPKIPPSVAAFHLSAEAQYGRYRTDKGEMALALFNYPTPSMARDQAEVFRKIPGILAKRAGPMVAVVPEVTDPDTAERLLSKVTYQASLTLNQATPSQEARGFARAVLTMFVLSGVIIGMCVLAGAAFAAYRIFSRGGASAIGEEMISLHIDSK